MSVKKKNIGIVCAALFLCLAAGCAPEKNKALSLQFIDTVYVEISQETFLSLDRALKRYGYGNVTDKNTETYYGYRVLSVDGKQASFMIMYTDLSFIPLNTPFQPMRVRQCYEIVLADKSAAGILVNPEVEGRQSYYITKEEIPAALPKIPVKEKIPWTIQFRN